MTQPPRLSDWETRFGTYLAEATRDARAGRKNFCALFAAGDVEAVIGVNPAPRFRGKHRHVADNLEATIDGLFPERPCALARRGDLAWYDGSVGVVIGAEALFVDTNERGEPDLVRVARAHWSKAWSVGDG